jgi:hypothetical protein
MSRNIAVSSDLAAARAVSRRLAGLAPMASSESDVQPYTSLGAAPTPMVRSAESGPAAELQEFTTWDGYLEWSMEFTGATAGFAVDPQGFVIGSAGERGEDGFEGLGAELSYIAGQARAMADEGEVLDGIGLVFSGRMVVGFRSAVEGAEGFLIGFVNPARYGGGVRDQLFQQLEHNVDHLR